MKRVKWDVEELVALIDIYRKSVSLESFNTTAALQSLTERLNKRADKLGIEHDEKFRNYNGMKMMFQNVIYIATDGKTGLSSASSGMKKVYSLLKSNPDAFDMILKEFNSKY